ncbi:nucleoside triphosphate pyrophosphohydrolase family protein [Parvibaculum sp.]|uniref:nucleoside triphosphate pyrophosphohydrolase family protein n=1 Tax=Parvibaculum sp. TaxID=2024848 RepID=UPI0032EAB7F5
MMDDYAPLTVRDYAERALKTDRGTDNRSLTFPLLGLFGETGSLLSEVKKKQRDETSYVGYAANVVEEFGDVLWYLTVVAARSGFNLADIAVDIDLPTTRSAPDSALTFADLQPEHMPQLAKPTPAFEHQLLQLAGEVGLLIIDQQAGLPKTNPSAVAGRLLTIMRTLIQAANDAGVTLEAAAVKNLHKTRDRWPEVKEYPLPLDHAAKPEEQLPRQLNIEIFERSVGGNVYVFQRCNEINIGDRLTDNAIKADDYRFHDVFHYAYAAILGWSPVMRALFRLKRKSDPNIDNAEDGARAILIEEGIATLIFGQAKELNFFEDIKTGELPFDMLKNIRQFVKGYECDELPLWLWEDAILQGFAAFRFLRKHRRGKVTLDMHNRTLSIEALP